MNLESILRDIKKFTPREILKAIETLSTWSRNEWAHFTDENSGKRQFWQRDNHAIELYSNSIIDQKVDYIHNNL
jgi:hypothetical protein